MVYIKNFKRTVYSGQILSPIVTEMEDNRVLKVQRKEKKLSVQVRERFRVLNGRVFKKNKIRQNKEGLKVLKWSLIFSHKYF